MHRLTRWFIHNPVAANLIMLLILIAGTLSLLSMRIEGFPKLPADTISIETLYSGAYTYQVDQQVTQRLEKALEGVAGIKKIRSESIDSYSSIIIQKNSGYSLQRLLDDVRIRIEGIYNLPKAAEKPIISRIDFDFPALYMQLYGKAGSQIDTDTLQRLIEQLREELLAQPEISKLNIWGKKKSEISIEVNPGMVEKYGLSYAHIITKIQQSSLTFKAGTLKTESGRISIRADNQATYQADFAAIPIIEKKDGSRLLLGDIAQISDDYEDNDSIVRFNGKPALGMEVLIGRKENLLEIADVVQNVVERVQKSFPDEIKISLWGDSSQYIEKRLGLLKNSALQGLLLVFCLLAIFLNFKLAFWVAMGIPISIAGTMLVLNSQWLDYSLNDITTFGFIIALGILVDDAVVVGESVFAQRKRHGNPLIGTAKGVQRVAMATIFGVLTTIAAFYPMLLIENALGKVLASFSAVVIVTLVFSLFESKFILPAHLAYIDLSLNKNQSQHKSLKFYQSIQSLAQKGLESFKEKIYKPLLIWSLQQRYGVLLVFISFAFLGLGLLYKGQIKTVFFPDIPGQIITVKVEMDARAPYQLTQKNAEFIEHIANTLNQEYRISHKLPENPIRHLLVVVNGAFSVDIYAELIPAAERMGLTTLAILKRWQQRVGILEGTTKLTFSGTEQTSDGFAIEIYSKNQDELKHASQSVMQYLATIKGIGNLRGSLKNGKPELFLELKPSARQFGFSNESLASQIGLLFDAAEIQRVQRNSREVKVLLRSDPGSRQSISDLMNSYVQSEDGTWYSLISIANIQSTYSIDYIARRDGKRVNSVRANIDKNQVAPIEIWQAFKQQLLPELEKKYPTVEIKGAGELEEMGKLKKNLMRAFVVTCFLIYALLAIPLKSYTQPFVIMSVIPFGFVGAAMGHAIMDLPLSILSFLGMLALAGVVVNDSLVMMTRYNQAIAEGKVLEQALVSACVGRFQAIFLTTATTVAGLMPLLNETSEQAQYLIPAAVSLAFGEIFATAITLILIPILIAIGFDIRGLLIANNLSKKEEHSS